jgi:GWxTD domain-containing protein
MNRCGRMAFGAVLLSLPFPFSILVRSNHFNRTSSVNLARRHIQVRIPAVPCFEASDSARSAKLEQDAVERLPAMDKLWLTEDAFDIISPQERCAFLHSATDEEREQFIEQFWSRRAPDLKSLTNSFEQQRYERIAFANKRFGTRIPGFLTDRGRIFVVFGPPDSVESHPETANSGGTTRKTNATRARASESWQYRHIDGLGDNVRFVFADPTGSADYRLISPRQLGHTSLFTSFGVAYSGLPETRPGASHLILYVGAAVAPIVQFKDLETMVTSHLIRTQVPFDCRIDFVRATHATTLARVTIQIRRRPLAPGETLASVPAAYRIFARLSWPSGRVAQTSEGLTSPAPEISSPARAPEYQLSSPLRPGTYRLAIAIENTKNGDSATFSRTFSVPAYHDVSLAHRAEKPELKARGKSRRGLTGTKSVGASRPPQAGHGVTTH